MTLPAPLAARLRAMTAARVALGHSGSGLPTRAALAFALDHARAREAVWSDMNLPALRAAFAGYPTATVASAAPDRAAYVRRPDLGRRLAPGAVLDLPKSDLVIVVADGLSATAVDAHAATVVAALQALRETPAPVVLAERGRVAIGDDIGAAVGAEAVVLLIGERPGLSAADSLGAYVTWAPEPGLPDSRRNCISNIRPGGLDPEEAAHRIAGLLAQMRRARISGVALPRAVPIAGETGPAQIG
ncbi:ethanolamine ammonia-lyase subunit EutC [Paenirhodobacter sp.]|uniref:ethanolamine ammonia-lyase subunit EutC n=1 Tax=Paenirhodobacter sp. TaxID=1965326 RepID=UPI003B3CCEC5